MQNSKSGTRGSDDDNRSNDELHQPLISIYGNPRLPDGTPVDRHDQWCKSVVINGYQIIRSLGESGIVSESTGYVLYQIAIETFRYSIDEQEVFPTLRLKREKPRHSLGRSFQNSRSSTSRKDGEDFEGEEEEEEDDDDDDDEDKKGVVANQETRGPNFIVWRRYSDFVRLRAQVIKNFPHLPIPKLPPKSIVRFNKGFLDERRKGLEYFICSILLHPDISPHRIVKQWLCNNVL